MILPNKMVKPVDSLFCISSYIVREISSEGVDVDELHEKINRVYPKRVSIETVILCLDYLFLIGKVEFVNETNKIKFG